jgi:hypothetical protein
MASTARNVGDRVKHRREEGEEAMSYAPVEVPDGRLIDYVRLGAVRARYHVDMGVTFHATVGRPPVDSPRRYYMTLYTIRGMRHHLVAFYQGWTVQELLERASRRP